MGERRKERKITSPGFSFNTTDGLSRVTCVPGFCGGMFLLISFACLELCLTFCASQLSYAVHSSRSFWKQVGGCLGVFDGLDPPLLGRPFVGIPFLLLDLILALLLCCLLISRNQNKNVYPRKALPYLRMACFSSHIKGGIKPSSSDGCLFSSLLEKKIPLVEEKLEQSSLYFTFKVTVCCTEVSTGRLKNTNCVE